MKISLNKLSKTQKTGVLIIALALVICVMLLPKLRELGGGEPADNGAAAEQTGSGAALVQIQDPEAQEMTDSKIEAYSSSSRASSSVARYWDDLEVEADAELGYEDGDGDSDGASSSAAVPAQASEDDLFANLTSGVTETRQQDTQKQTARRSSGGGGGGGSSSTKKSAPKPGEPGYREYRMKQYYDDMDAAVQRGEAQRAASSQEASTEITASGEPLDGSVPIGDDAPVRKSSAMSDLSSGAGSGFSTLGDQASEVVTEDEDYPFECMFVRAEKLRNGSRVSVRLLEDMVVGGTLIPKNTHLMAMCSIGDRLQLTIANVEMNQKIFSLGYEAYDTDGSKGIYCPDLMQSERQKVTSSGLSSIGGLLGRRVGSLASTAVSTGVSIAQSKSGEVTVSVPAGYRFFIVKKKK